MDSLCRRLRACWYCMQRLKTAADDTQLLDLTQPRYHTVFDLISVGSACALPLALFVVAGAAMRDAAGPSVVISVLVAALAAAVSGLCHSELRARVYRLQTTAYEYTYRTLGEAAAVVVGLSLTLHHITMGAACARAISANFDFLLNCRISNLTIQNLGTISSLESYADFVAFFAALLAMVATSLGLSLQSKLHSIITSSITIVVLIFTLVVSLYHLDFDRWQTQQLFFLGGSEGVFSGAAALFAVFAVYEPVLRHSDLSSRTARRPALLSILISHNLLLITTLLLAAVLSLIASPSLLTTEAPYPEAFTVAGVGWIKYIVCPVAVLVLIPVLLKQSSESGQVFSSMAHDGLTFPMCGYISDRTDAPICSVVTSGVITSIAAMLFNVTSLVEISSGCLIFISVVSAVSSITFHYKPDLVEEKTVKKKFYRQRRRRQKRTAACKQACDNYNTIPSHSRSYNDSSTSSILLAGSTPVIADNNESIESPMTSATNNNGIGHKQISFQELDLITHAQNSTQLQNNDSSSDTDIDEVVEEYRDVERTRIISDYTPQAGFIIPPTKTTHERVNKALVLYVAICVLLAITAIKGGSAMRNGNIVVILLLVSFIIGLTICSGWMLRQPKNFIHPITVIIQVPNVPLVPLVAILLNIHLITALQPRALAVALVWMVSGCLFYFSYGIGHSKEANYSDHFPEEHRGLLPQRPSTSAQQIVPVDSTASPAQGFIDDDDDEDDTLLIVGE